MNTDRSINVGGSFTGVVNSGDNSVIQTGSITSKATDQSVNSTAQEIHSLLVNLSQLHPTETLTQKATVAEMAVRTIEQDSFLKQRVISALKAAGKEAFKQAVDHPVVHILVEAISGWQGNG